MTETTINNCDNCSNFDAIPEGCETDGKLCVSDEFECHVPIINNVEGSK